MTNAWMLFAAVMAVAFAFGLFCIYKLKQLNKKH